MAKIERLTTKKSTRSNVKARSPKKVAANTPVKEKVAARWTFLSNHSHVLILPAQDQSIVLREVSSKTGITERAVQRIIVEQE